MKEFNFDKVEIRKSEKKTSNKVLLWAKTGSLVLPLNFTEELGWKAKDRVDLYRDGNTYALKKDPNGRFTLRELRNLEAHPLHIQSKLVTDIISKSTKHYKAKIYDDMLIFNY